MKIQNRRNFGIGENSIYTDEKFRIDENLKMKSMFRVVDEVHLHVFSLGSQLVDLTIF